MATVNIVFATIGGPSGTANAYNGNPLASANVTSSGTSAQSAAASVNCTARIVATGNIWAAVGADPTAAAGDWYIPTGQALDLFLNSGDKVAVIDA